ncbi:MULTISPECIES: cytochrome c oxidase subunit 3 [unclassified Spirosoma]|uniref:cytochrome c oxidase subunit 3 n=1 Tax=unclassified Spirosoma TaxID=2621999 RepID=UPI0009656668|nr:MULTISPECIES: cytochrome c oxidase subunit 3 [unclassified Spirosoma]MBN8822871.1 cytochrome c oxidase subunit 3 [Spirosoma sp.]OJW80064.1 MAG: cytochrome oxidase subunit III [Spirosoma sp. 48-14]
MSELVNNITLVEEPEETLSMNPRKFILWLFIVSIIMLFAAMTSAYLVRRAEGNWLEYAIPSIFYYSSVVLVLSSLTMHWAYLSAKKDNFGNLKIAITITFVLGAIFLYMQFLGWVDLVNENVFFVGNPAGSFMYIFTGLHGFHLISGIIVLVFALVAAFRLRIHAKSLNQIEIAATYWHFLDILWLYLFFFLVYFH